MMFEVLEEDGEMTTPADYDVEELQSHSNVSFTQPMTGEEPETWEDACESFVRYGYFPWVFSEPDVADILDGIDDGVVGDA